MHLNKLNFNCIRCNHNKYTTHPSLDNGYFCNKCGAVYQIVDGNPIPKTEELKHLSNLQNKDYENETLEPNINSISHLYSNGSIFKSNQLKSISSKLKGNSEKIFYNSFFNWIFLFIHAIFCLTAFSSINGIGTAIIATIVFTIVWALIYYLIPYLYALLLLLIAIAIFIIFVKVSGFITALIGTIITVFILAIIFMILLYAAILLPGIFFGIITFYAAGKGLPGFIIGFIIFSIVTGIVYFILRFVIPFVIGFSLALFSGLLGYKITVMVILGSTVATYGRNYNSLTSNYSHILESIFLSFKHPVGLSFWILIVSVISGILFALQPAEKD